MPGFVDYLSTDGYILLLADLYAAYVMFIVTRGRELGRESGIIPLFLGIASLLLSVDMDVVWPLPGPYNFVFGDPFTVFSVLVLSAGTELLLFGNLKYIEGLAVPAGLISIFYGIVIAVDSLDPLPVWGMFVLEGVAGALTGVSVNGKSKPLMWIALLFLALSSILLAAVCLQTTLGHVTDFAKYYPRLFSSPL